MAATIATGDGERKSGLRSPTISTQTSKQHAVVNVYYLSPLSQRMRRTVPGNQFFSRVALIARLFFDCGPLAILWPIIAIIVDTLKRERFAGTWPHVRQKGVKRIPSSAHLNATPSVILICVTFRIFTSSVHCIKRYIFWSLAGIRNGLSVAWKKVPTSILYWYIRLGRHVLTSIEKYVGFARGALQRLTGFILTRRQEIHEKIATVSVAVPEKMAA